MVIPLKLTVLPAAALPVSSVNFNYKQGANLPISEHIDINPSWSAGWTLSDSCGSSCSWLLLPTPATG
jgi:hypothetical protein